MHVISIDQISKRQMFQLFETARFFENQKSPLQHYCPNKILYNLFYEPSTRTSSSFFAAMVRLGGHVIPVNSVQYSSVVKGEDLEDTIITAGCYSDVIVLRHTETGAAQRAADVSSVPIINAGDGSGEHPTQTLLDAYTIWKRQEWFKGLTITMMGDLKNGRTVHSLAKLLSRFAVKLNFVAPEAYQLPSYVRSDLFKRAEVNFTFDLKTVLRDTDVLYVTRVQRERGSEFTYTLTNENVQQMKDNAIVMHPLPRNEELPKWFDLDSRAVYFEQMRNGMWVRMALLLEVLEK